jgi:hypothetical protein
VRYERTSPPSANERAPKNEEGGEIASERSNAYIDHAAR